MTLTRKASAHDARIGIDGTFRSELHFQNDGTKEASMNFGKGVLLWLLGIPIPIILLLALFWHH
jgi:hypothetical protein